MQESTNHENQKANENPIGDQFKDQEVLDAKQAFQNNGFDS